MKEIGKIQSAIQNRHAIHVVTQNWDADTLEIVRLSLLLMERGLDRITGKQGGEWIRKNLGGTQISLGSDESFLGNAFVMKKVFNGRAHVIGNRVYLPLNFYASAWRKPRGNSDLWIIHELGHVWDNRSAHGWGSILGGGYGDQLLKYMGGSVKGFPLFRFMDNSLEINRECAFNCGGSLDYGNNSPADFFANNFVAAITLPKAKGVPTAARGWMSDLIRRTI
jgi:hypothetical protein